MFPRTIRDLTTRPGYAAKKFIEGNRVLYYGPVGYFFLMITLFVLFLGLLDINIVEFMKSNNPFTNDEGFGEKQKMAFQNMMQVMTDNLKLISFIFIPLQALASRYIFFRKQPYNFLEHAVLPLYMQGHIYWLNIFGSIYFMLTDSFGFNLVKVVLSIVYICFGYSTIFSNEGKLKAAAKGFGVYIVSQLLFSLLVAILVGLMLWLNPEFFELMRPSNNR
ncbi:MAG: DUF3667 domain-containing protein, partial [Cyclobacteriaceae bacterium]|nr:DUF3667 domain-containing protein [Cyclobacteriaceae bacterium]